MKFESMRHGHKEGENLSERGKEQAKEKAKALLCVKYTKISSFLLT